MNDRADPARTPASPHATDETSPADPTRPGASVHADGLDGLTAAYEDAYNDLHLQALSLLGSPEAAADVVHDAFAETAAKIKEGSEIRNLGGWLRKVVRNIALMRLRRKPMLPLDEHHVGTSGTALETVDAKQLCDAVYRVVRELPSAQRSAFLMAEVHGFKNREIAASLGRTDQAVRQLLHRARSQIRDIVGRDYVPLATPFLPAGACSQVPSKGRIRAVLDHAGAELANLRASVTATVGHSGEPITRMAEPSTATVVVALVIGLLGPPAPGGPAATEPSPSAAPIPALMMKSTTDHSRFHSRALTPGQEPRGDVPTTMRPIPRNPRAKPRSPSGVTNSSDKRRERAEEEADEQAEIATIEEPSEPPLEPPADRQVSQSVSDSPDAEMPDNDGTGQWVADWPETAPLEPYVAP